MAVAGEQGESERLLEMNIVGETSEIYRFGYLRGHSVICLPFSLTDFLSVIGKLEDMYIEEWDGLISASHLGNISKAVRAAEDLLTNNVKQNADIVIETLLSELEKVDWLTWLRDPHEDIKVVNNFIKMYPSARPKGVNECSKIITGIQDILSRTFIIYESI